MQILGFELEYGFKIAIMEALENTGKYTFPEKHTLLNQGDECDVMMCDDGTFLIDTEYAGEYCWSRWALQSYRDDIAAKHIWASHYQEMLDEYGSDYYQDRVLHFEHLDTFLLQAAKWEGLLGSGLV